MIKAISKKDIALFFVRYIRYVDCLRRTGWCNFDDDNHWRSIPGGAGTVTL